MWRPRVKEKSRGFDELGEGKLLPRPPRPARAGLAEKEKEKEKEKEEREMGDLEFIAYRI